MQKFLGQHFLKNTAVIAKIITTLDVQPNETIIEIGPGHGELTLPLAEVCKKIGAKIIAVEKDAKLATALEDERAKNVLPIEIINADILDFLKASPPTETSFKIVGNIPYYLTGHLLRTIGELETRPKLAVLMIQKEVAERVAATPPRMNRLAASVQFWAIPKVIAQVPRADFLPPPEVDSAVVAFEAKLPPPKNADPYYAAVRALFVQPRKTILNNLAKGTPTINKEGIIAILSRLGIDPKSRPQDLTIENIAEIAEKNSFYAVHK